MWTYIYESRSDNGGYPVSKPIKIASDYIDTILVSFFKVLIQFTKWSRKLLEHYYQIYSTKIVNVYIDVKTVFC